MTALAARSLTRAALRGAVKLFAHSLAWGNVQQPPPLGRTHSRGADPSKTGPSSPNPAHNRGQRGESGRTITGENILSCTSEGMVSTILCQPMLSTPDVVVLSHADVRKTNRL
jgi:hypothetical protein